MSSKWYWMVNYMLLCAALLWSGGWLWLATGLAGYTHVHHHDVFDKYGVTNTITTHSPASIEMKAFSVFLVFSLWSIVLLLCMVSWYKNHHLEWWRQRESRREHRRAMREVADDERARRVDQRRLRELALVAAENDVYTSIATGNPITQETAMLLRSSGQFEARL